MSSPSSSAASRRGKPRAAHQARPPLAGALVRWAAFSAIAVAAAMSTGCGGSSGSTAASAPAPETTPVAVQVIDGAIVNAVVCLDVNRNGACDAGEPSGRTDASGKATLNVAAADAGKYPVLALIGTDAVDADHGPVTTPFVMKAPADKTAVVSPLTTLVQSAVETTGTTSDKAAESVQAQLGMDVSVFQDYTANKTRQGTTLAAVARMVVVTQQQQSAALASAVGTPAIDGSTVSKVDIDKLVMRRLAEILPELVQALSDPAVQAAITAGDIKQVNAALTPLAQAIVSDAVTGIKPAAVAVLVGASNQAVNGTNDLAAPTPGAQLHTLTFTDAQNWFRRFITNSAADVVVDAQGMLRFRDNRMRSVGGVRGSWSFGNSPDRQSDFHWSGTAWVQCSLQLEGKATVRDSAGRSSYNYCDGHETGTNSRAVFDVSGRKLLDVYNQARDAGFTNLSITGADTALGAAVFPAGSKVMYYNGQPTSNALAYIPNTSNVIRVYGTDALAAGTQADCNAIGNVNSAQYTVEPATLEAMAARASGNGCIFQPATITGAGGATLSSGARNEFWNFAALSLGQIGTATVPGSTGASTTYYTTNQLLRVAFGADKAVKYYSCQQRSQDGGTRNCDLIGTGTYTITTVGDARVMALQNPPAQAGTLTYERLFVERGGKVYFGYKGKATAFAQARLNKEAANALVAQLGAGPAVDPEDSVTLLPGSWAGDWMLWPTADSAAWTSTNAGLLRISSSYNGGSTGYQCFDTLGGAPTTAFTCTLTLNPTTGAVTLVDSTSTLTMTLDFAHGTGTGSALESSVTTPIQGRRR